MVAEKLCRVQVSWEKKVVKKESMFSLNSDLGLQLKDFGIFPIVSCPGKNALWGQGAIW